MSKKEITVTTIMYKGDDCGNPYSHEDTTLLSFDEWLIEHNKWRVKENGGDEDFNEDECEFEWFEHTFTV
jgi:hypothetical protein